MLRRCIAAVLATALPLLAAGPLRAASDTPDPALPKTQTAACDRAQFRAVIDVGHTAEVPGAISARGAHEYDFNLRLAKVIVQNLIDAGFGRTLLLVTDGPAMAGLARRVEAADRAGAALLLSIHHDSVPDRFLEDWEFEGKPSHFSDRFSGHSIFVSADSPFYKPSLLFARLLGRQMKDRGLQYTPHYTEAYMGNRRRELVDADAGVYRYDQLVVLRSPQMPAVLLEAGSIINRDDELALATPERQALISAAATDAVTQFCEQRPTRAQVARPAAAPAAGKAASPLAPLINLFGHR